MDFDLDFDFNFDFDGGDFTFEGQSSKLPELLKNGFFTDFVKTSLAAEDIKQNIKASFNNAVKSGKVIADKIKSGERGWCTHLFTSGNFSLVDFLIAIIGESGSKCERIDIMQYTANLDALEKLVQMKEYGVTKEMNIVLSQFWYADFKDKGWEGMKKKFIDADIKYAFIRMHLKVIVITFENGTKIVIEGSGNLRNSICIENETITEDAEYAQQGHDFCTMLINHFDKYDLKNSSYKAQQQLIKQFYNNI